jgi:tetratricopeptide (TPR) repeat protein
MLYNLEVIGGAPRITSGGKLIQLSSRRAVGVLVYLTINHPRRVPRSELCDLLWRGGDLGKQRHRISQLLYTIEKHCPSLLERDGELIYISFIQCDAADALSLLSQRNYSAIVKQFSGEFLPGFSIDAAPGFNEWVDEIRSRLSRGIATAFDSVLAQAELSADWEAAVDVRRRAAIAGLAIDESGVSGETDGINRPPSDNYGIADHPRMVGRKAEFALAGQFLFGTDDPRARAIVISGSIGIGKTTLLHQLGKLGAIRGYRVFTIRCYEVESSISLGTATNLIREVLFREHVAIPDSTKAFLAGLVPELGIPSGDFTRGGPLFSMRLYKACDELINDSHGLPILLVIDDSQWVDQPSREIIAYLLREGTKRTRWCFSAGRMVDWLGNAESLNVHLEGLSREDIWQIASRANPMLETEAGHLEAIAGAAAGNPLIAVELARSATIPAHFDFRPTPSPAVVPKAIRLSVEKQLRGVTPEARELLATIAVLGRYAERSVIAKATPTQRSNLHLTLAYLQDNELVGSASDCEYRLSTELLREVILEHVPPGTRRLIFERCGLVLARMPHVPSKLPAICFDRAGEQALAARYYMKAAAECGTRHAHEEAISCYDDAMGVAPTEQIRARVAGAYGRYLTVLGRYTEASSFFELERKSGGQGNDAAALIAESFSRFYAYAAPASRVRADIQRVVDALSEEVPSSVLAVALESLIISAHEEGAGDVVRAVSEIAVQVAEHQRDGCLRSRCYASASKAQLLYGCAQRSLEFAQAAVFLAEASGDTAAVIQALSARAVGLYYSGQLTAAESDYAAAEGMATGALSHLASKATAFRGVVLIDLGNLEAARMSLQKAIRRSYGHERIIGMINMAALEIDQGEYGAAYEWTMRTKSEVKAQASVWLRSAISGLGGIAAVTLRMEAECKAFEKETLDCLQHKEPGSILDVGYSVIFLAKLREVAGDHIGAVQVLREWIDSEYRMPASSHLRMRLELARLMVNVDRATAWRIAADVRSAAIQMAAERLQKRANSILVAGARRPT